MAFDAVRNAITRRNHKRIAVANRISSPRRPKRTSLSLQIEALEARHLLDSTLVFNEVMYNPSGSGEQLEWIELYNQMAVDVDASRWELRGGVNYTFPLNTIVPGGGYLVIAKSPGDLAAASGFADALGPFDGQLSNSGEEIELVNHTGRTMDLLDYSDDGRWPAGPDGSGASLAKLKRSAATDIAENWSTSTLVGGTPGELNFDDGGPIGLRERVLIGPGSEATYHVPASGTLGNSWQAPGFDDDAWAAGSLGIGFDADVPPEIPTSSLVNVAFSKPVIFTTGNYAGLAGFEATNVTDGSTNDVFSSGAANSSTYWLGRQGVTNEAFVLDLQAAFPIEEIRLRNTHNTQYNDRGTAQFRIFAANSVNASNQLVNPVQILTGTLSAVSNQDPINAAVFRSGQGLTNTTARYLRFEAITSTYGNGHVGLNEIEVYSPSAPDRTNLALGRPVIDASGTYQHSLGFERSNITDGSTSDVTTDGTLNSSTYWLGREGVSQEYVTVDLQSNVRIDEIRLRNTHNVQFNDRGTAAFEIYAASSIDDNKQLVNPQRILTGTLPAVTGQNPIPAQVFKAAQGLIPTSARYLRFNALSSIYPTGHVGLNELEVYGLGAATPLAYWDFENTLADASGNGFNGTMATPSYVAEGAPGAAGTKSMAFDGIDDFMSATIDVSEQTYTAAMWIKTTTAGRGIYAVVDPDLGGNGNDRHLFLSGTNLATRTWNNEGIASTGLNLADGQWHHIAHVFGGSAGGQDLYVDGALVASGSRASSDFTWQTRINLGFSNDATGQYFSGQIDEAAIWSQALNPAQIAALAAGTSPLLLAGFVGQIATDIQPVMQGSNPSVYVRTEFSVANASQFDQLSLDVKYDDGFVAYLNGVKVAEANAPVSPAWNSAASIARNDNAASAFQTFDLTPHLSLLVNDTNVLAIQGLNVTAADADFLILPQLRGHLADVETFSGGLVINEVDGAGDATFRVELKNRGATPIDLGGLIIATTSGAGADVTLPPQTLAPGEYTTISETVLGFRPATDEKLFLFAAGRGAVLDAVSVRDQARGRSPDGNGAWRYTSADTFGTGANGANAFAFRDEIVINEIMYHHRPNYDRPATPATYETTSLVAVTDVYKYSDLASEPATQSGTTWRQNAYNDTAWASGGGLLYTTASALVPAPRTTALAGARATYYFRKSFSFTGDLNGAELQLRHIVDDGAVFYLNGTEIARFNITTPAVPTYSSPATAVVGNGAYSDYISVPTNLLRTDGTSNVLAVEVHNIAPGGDLVFGAELSLRKQLTPAIEAAPFTESDEEWIELFNKSDHAVDLTDWDLSGGIAYEFPAGTTIPSGGYLVVASNPIALAAKYPNVTIIGGFSGGLNNTDDRIVLEDNFNNPADEVHYYEAGRWAAAADGGGSSLELRSPGADNSIAEAWAASNEAPRSEWEHYTYTSTAIAPVYDPVTSQAPASDFREFIFGLLDAGDVLVDNVSVREDPAGTNIERIQNGTFTADAIGAIPNKWRVLGTHADSRVVADPTDPTNRVLYINADGKADYLDNRLETTLVGNAQIVPGRTYTISFDAKWLSGTPQLRSELYYNRVAKVTRLAEPESSGTPGGQNSVFSANIGPTYAEFRHGPVIPAANEAATVTVRASDPQGIATMTLRYAVNGGAWQSVPMTLSAGGIYQGQIPGQPASATVQFYVQGTDTLGANSTYPAAGADSRALIRWQDGRARTNGPQHNFRMLMNAADVSLMHSATNLMSNDRLGGTIVYDEQEVFYDVGIRLRGSMFSRQSQGSTGYNIKFQPDQLFRGTHESVAIKTPGKAEMLVKHTEVAGDIPGMYDDFMYLNTPSGSGDGIAISGLTRFGEEYISTQFEDGGEGTVFKFQGIRVLLNNTGTEALKTYMPIGWVGNFDLANLGNDKEQYRWSIQIMNNRAEDDYTAIVDMMQALSLTGSALQNRIDDVIDVDQWMRVFALQSLWGIGDAYTQGNPHNLDFYVRPTDGKVIAMPWDWNFVASYSATSGLYGFQPGNFTKVIDLPIYKRLFLGHMRDWINTIYNQSYMAHWTEHYGAMSGENYSNYLNYIGQRATHVTTLINQQAPMVAFNITTNGGAPVTVNDSVATIAGDGWIDVREIRLAGSDTPLEVEWTDFDSWRAIVPVAFGTHAIELQAFNHQGSQVGSDTITVTSTVSDRPLQDFLRVSELMYHPADPSATELSFGITDSDEFEFIELLNTSATATLDLSSVRLVNGIDFDFAAADMTSLAPGARIVLVANRDAFELRYGDDLLVAGQYSGRLNNAGETLSIVDGNDQLIQTFTYDDSGEGWHPATDGDGYSLVILNPLGTLESWNEGASWRPSFIVGGEPGTTDSTLPGDFNSDGAVDVADLAILQSHYGMATDATTADGDLTGDGAVNRADAAAFSVHFGRTAMPAAPSPAPAAAVHTQANRPSAQASSSSRLTVSRRILRADAVDQINGASSREAMQLLSANTLRRHRTASSNLGARVVRD